MTTLKIPSIGELQLIIDGDCERFAACELNYITLDGEVTHLYTDYLYIFVEGMFKRICNTCVIPERSGQCNVISMGKWQEYCYFSSQFLDENEEYISLMEKSTFISGDKYCLLLYRYKGIIWLELNKCYESGNMLPTEYYDTPSNYQIFIVSIANETILEWKHCLKPLYEKVCI